MNDRDRIRIYGDGVKKTKFDVFKISKKERDNIRGGILPLTKDLFKYFPILNHKEPISIIITAYKTQNFIKECLNSIKEQTYFINNDEYEILVGIDGCDETLQKMLEIKSNYKNIRVFMMNKNAGTYITSNTLMSLVKNENVIRFDSDDIMMPEMINEIMYYNNEYNLIRFFFFGFENNDVNLIGFNRRYAHGAIFIKKSLFDSLGGYKPWLCAADTELLVRGVSKIKEKQINKPLFYRRMHHSSLIANRELGLFSEKRNRYTNLIGKHKEIKIKRIVNKYVEY